MAREPGYLKDRDQGWTVGRFGLDGKLAATRTNLSRDLAEEVALAWSHREDTSHVSCTEAKAAA